MPPAKYALHDACRTLFGDQVNLGNEFLAYLQPSGAKVAFRSQAMRHHPDRFAFATAEVKARQTARFREIQQAYQLLANYLEGRPSPRPDLPPHPERQRPRRQTSVPAKVSGIPPMPMEFGIFAYHRGHIEYRDLIDALIWQRRQRPTLGNLACQWGWLSEDKVRRILGHRGTGGRFGRRAVVLGLLSAVQVEALLRHQRTRQQPLGRYFIERGLMTAATADQLARELELHNARFASGPN